MLKRNRVSTKEIIDYLHPAYLNGRIQDSNDIEIILQDEIVPEGLRIQFSEVPLTKGLSRVSRKSQQL